MYILVTAPHGYKIKHSLHTFGTVTEAVHSALAYTAHTGIHCWVETKE